ncbi:hypothetical protein Tco_1356113 [Tanacetum coccineum]
MVKYVNIFQSSPLGMIGLGYIKEMLKKFRLEDSKPTKTPISTEIKLNQPRRRCQRRSSSLRMMKPTSWIALNIKKQTALAISTTEAEYVSAEKACQEALWMKQALIDYEIRLDDVSIMFGNKGAIYLSKNPGNISIDKVASDDNIADIFIKPLKHKVFNSLRLGLGMMELIMDIG